MPAASTLTVTLPRDRWWTAGVSVWVMLATGSSLAWALSMQAAGHPAWAFLLPLLAALHAAWLLRLELRARPAVLRWDELQGWSLDRGHGASAATARIALDFDRWLLLEIAPGALPAGAPSPSPRLAWIAASAGRMQPGQWHALRCALARRAIP